MNEIILPKMVKQKRGIVTNIASKAGERTKFLP
jgi:NADP-dependent 3-hydroxy acid dehydrogenase YdfG